jgi:hypothetical protein
LQQGGPWGVQDAKRICLISGAYHLSVVEVASVTNAAAADDRDTAAGDEGDVQGVFRLTSRTRASTRDRAAL